MHAQDLSYINLTANVLPSYSLTGRTESISFLVWFLENIFRLDDVQAADAICDGPSDRGIDAIFVDHDNSEIIFLQSKVRQNDSRQIGDQPIRDFAGSIAQFNTPEKVSAAIETGKNSEISRLLVRSEISARLTEGYSISGVFVTNAIATQACSDAAKAVDISVYDRDEIAERYIESDAPDRIGGTKAFDVSDIGYLEFNTGKKAKLYLITAKAMDLLKLDGLADGTLFAQNVRLSLGNTKVNRDVAKTIDDQSKHLFFPMYHNGITIICRHVDTSDPDQLNIADYVVVNGAQSLSVLFRNRAKISGDLRVVVKIIEINEDDRFSKDITIASNNQNSIKPRDMRSTNLLQTRLQVEFEQIDFQNYRYIIKRGEEMEGKSISNEDAGRNLLAFDVKEPWSCHQIYKVFDEKYTQIFGRPVVTAWRIILLDKIMERIERALPQIGSEPIQKYRLTRYFLAYAISKIIDEDEGSQKYISEPRHLLNSREKLERFLDSIESLTRRLCVDIRFEFTEGDNSLDYKLALKNSAHVQDLESRLRRSFLHDVARGRETMPSKD